MPRPRILLTLPTTPEAEAMLAPVADLVMAPDTSFDTLRRLTGEVDVIIVRTQLPPDLLDRPHRLLGIVRHGTGLDMIPVEAATAQAVPVANVPGVNAETVAEYCIGSMLALARRAFQSDRDLRAHGWVEARRHSDHALEVFGRTIGIIGMGSIGTRVAQIAHQAFGMRVLGHQRRLEAMPAFVEPADVDRLCREADFVSLNCPLTPQTRGLIDEARLRSMKPTAAIINAARGPVTDEAALARALAEGWIAGAAIDVYGEQPLPRDHPFLTLPNVILSPHSAGLSREATLRMSVGCAEQILQLLRGERPTHMVNPAIWDAHLARVRAFAP